MSSGHNGVLKKIRFRPRRRSYVCRLLPTDVVIWNVVLPKGTEVKGTGVEETSPIVRNGANSLELGVLLLTAASNFCRFAAGVSKSSFMTRGAIWKKGV